MICDFKLLLRPAVLAANHFTSAGSSAGNDPSLYRCKGIKKRKWRAPCDARRDTPLKETLLELFGHQRKLQLGLGQ
jgi:hypothetical protein